VLDVLDGTDGQGKPAVTTDGVTGNVVRT